MARTVTEIYNSILAEKAKYQSLESLESTSKAAIWRSIYYVTAVTIAVAEQLRDVFQAELIEIAETLPTGTTKWYAATLLEYQEGYELTYNRTTGAIEYEVLDEEARILQVATCESESDTVVLKTAKSDGANGLEPLTATEYNSVLAYINQYKFAGTIVSLFSQDPDRLSLSLNVRVDATVIASDGTSVLNPSEYPVEDAINTFIKEYGLINFDSTFKLTELTDAIQQVSGVKNTVVTLATAIPTGGTEPQGILSTPLHTYKAEAGYLTIDPTHTLRNNITYIV